MYKKITADDYAKLTNADIKALYKVQKDGTYKLDLEDDDDVDALKRAKDHEKREAADAKAKREAAEAKLVDAQKELEALNGNANKSAAEKTELETKLKDYDKLQKNYDKLAKQVADEFSYNRKMASDNLLGGSAKQMAETLAGKNAALLLPHVMSRLSVEFKDDNDRVGTLVVKDAAGKPTTLDNLQKELASDKTFAPIVVGSRAHGGSAPASPGYVPGSSGSATPNGQTPSNGAAPNFNTMSPAQLKAHVESIHAAKAQG